MKTGWERSNPLILPDQSTVSKMLQPFLNERQILKLEPLGGGLSNTNIKVSLTNGENFVLRIYNDDGTKGHIEKGVLQLVKSTIPVPQVLYHDASLSQFEYPYLVLDWIKGTQLSELFISRDQQSLVYAGQEVGRVLASLHAIQFTSPGFFDEQLTIQRFDGASGAEFFVDLIERIISERPVTENLGPELVNEIRQFVNEHAQLVDDIGNQSSLVHSDFNPLNILIEKDEDNIKITGILDWEFSFSNSPLIDIGNMLRYEDVKESPFIQPFISSYLKHGGDLPQKWLQKAKLLDLIALCELANKEACGEVRVRDIKNLISRTMNEWELYEEVQEDI
ncbi:phosphotransferase family protein [Thalassobacillus hwangdonensis]|uniref:phosphotransferase family protein n=1 Tax=Thalassobacillus hwangdonensis TaxID=546108 RepID=UPI0036D77AFA